MDDSIFPTALELRGASVSRVQSLLDEPWRSGACSRGCTTSTKLHWWGARIGDVGCAELAARLSARTHNLTNLLLGSNGIGDACMRQIGSLADEGRLSTLRALGLSRNRVTDSGCRSLAAALERGGVPMLRELYLSGNAIGDPCAADLGRALASPRAAPLERLGINDLELLTDEGLVALLSPLRATGGGARTLREISVRNGSRLCAAAVSTERLLNTIGALATARDSPPSLRKRHLHLAMHSSACRAAAREQAWSEARQRWAKEQHGEVRVTVH